MLLTVFRSFSFEVEPITDALCRVYTSATCCAQHATCCGQQATCCTQLDACCPQQVARNKHQVARNLLRATCCAGVNAALDSTKIIVEKFYTSCLNWKLLKICRILYVAEIFQRRFVRKRKTYTARTARSRHSTRSINCALLT